jgi:hypothetical protein
LNLGPFTVDQVEPGQDDDEEDEAEGGQGRLEHPIQHFATRGCRLTDWGP